ncbi:kinase-like protein [Gigaspora margarita]|nr:kinase-like protein [Gigaspora margarita]
MLGGLDAAVSKMPWSHHTRVILHIGDAPPHKHLYSSLNDDYPDGDPNGLTARRVFHKMKTKKIMYSFRKITEYTLQMINVFQHNSEKFLMFDVALDNNPETLLQKFIKAVTSTVISSVSLNSKIASTKNSLSIYSINESKLKVNPREPNWADLPILNGLILEYYLPINVNEIKDPEHFRKSQMNSNTFYFKIAPYSFDRSAQHSAFFSFDMNRTEKMVLKKYYNGDNSISCHYESSEISTIAYFLAKKFNSACEKNNIKKKISSFILELIWKISLGTTIL